MPHRPSRTRRKSGSAARADPLSSPSRVRRLSQQGGERGWLFEEFDGLNSELPLDALGITLPLAELYDGIPLLAPEAA